MKLTLPPDVLKTLPAPDRNGMVRVVVSMEVGDDGEATVSEINAVPVAAGDPEEEAEGEEPNPSADDPAAADSAMPSADQIDKGMYDPMQQP